MSRLNAESLGQQSTKSTKRAVDKKPITRSSNIQLPTQKFGHMMSTSLGQSAMCMNYI
jgi:hypothetical protein